MLIARPRKPIKYTRKYRYVKRGQKGKDVVPTMYRCVSYVEKI